MVAQEEVKGVRILAPEEVRWHKPDEQRYFKDQESQKTIKKDNREETTKNVKLKYNFGFLCIVVKPKKNPQRKPKNVKTKYKFEFFFLGLFA